MVFRGLADSQVSRPKLEANQRRGRAGRTGPGAYGPQSFEQWEIFLGADSFPGYRVIGELPRRTRINFQRGAYIY